MKAYFFAGVSRFDRNKPGRHDSMIWRVLLVATVLFVWIAEKYHPIKSSMDQRLYAAICIVAVSEIGIMFFLQKRWQTKNSSGPADPKNAAAYLCGAIDADGMKSRRRSVRARGSLYGRSASTSIAFLYHRLFVAPLPQAEADGYGIRIWREKR